MNENNASLAGAEARPHFQVSLLSAFDEIAQTVLRTASANLHTSLQSYLDGVVLIGGASVSRRAILLAVHDMKDDLEAPQALQEKAHAEMMSLKVRPTPELRFYRDLATLLLRLEVVIRFQARRNGETRH